MCTQDGFPAIKWFSPEDQSSTVPPITCVRVDKHVAGVSWKVWADWLKIARFLSEFP